MYGIKKLPVKEVFIKVEQYKCLFIKYFSYFIGIGDQFS